jgi:hypothetical protein
VARRVQPRCAVVTKPQWWLPVTGVLVGVWAGLPRFVGPDLNVSAKTEVVDHVVPALVIIVLSVIALVFGRRRAAADTFMFIAGLALCLAGLWMVATHLPLVVEAAKGEARATWGAVVWHSVPAVAVALLGVIWLVICWSPN